MRYFICMISLAVLSELDVNIGIGFLIGITAGIILCLLQDATEILGKNLGRGE